jgi:hypothetical protein
MRLLCLMPDASSAMSSCMDAPAPLAVSGTGVTAQRRKTRRAEGGRGATHCEVVVHELMMRGDGVQRQRLERYPARRPGRLRQGRGELHLGRRAAVRRLREVGSVATPKYHTRVGFGGRPTRFSEMAASATRCTRSRSDSKQWRSISPSSCAASSSLSICCNVSAYCHPHPTGLSIGGTIVLTAG